VRPSCVFRRFLERGCSISRRGHGGGLIRLRLRELYVSCEWVAVSGERSRSFPLANRSLITKLGYAGAKIPQIPSQLVSMVPRGPSLDPAAARQAAAP